MLARALASAKRDVIQERISATRQSRSGGAYVICSIFNSCCLMLHHASILVCEALVVLCKEFINLFHNFFHNTHRILSVTSDYQLLLRGPA